MVDPVEVHSCPVLVIKEYKYLELKIGMSPAYTQLAMSSYLQYSPYI